MVVAKRPQDTPKEQLQRCAPLCLKDNCCCLDGRKIPQFASLGSAAENIYIPQGGAR